MQLLTTGILFSMVFVAESLGAGFGSDGENVCFKTETYEETIEVVVLKPYTEKIKKMCWSISNFFRCEKSATKLKLVKEPKVVQRTKTVLKCCDGYTEEKGQVNKCSPVCLNGCKNGKCVAPGVCACGSGFYGPECEKVCPKNFWGNNCINKCDCSNNGNCDNISGGCHCDLGWRGKSCELPCEDGFYGFYCKQKCNCDNHLCNHKTGECLTTTEDIIIVTQSSTTEESSAETIVKLLQPTEGSITTDEETTTIKKGFLLEDERRTVKEDISLQITSGVSDLTTILEDENIIMKMTEEPNKNEKETKIINVEQITEVVTEISKEEISAFEISSNSNSTENVPIWTSFSESEKSFDTNEIDNFIIGGKRSFSNKRTMPLFHFPPSLSVISSASFLIFIIAAKWIISKHRKKAKAKAIITGKKEKLFQSEEQIKFQAENFFWVNNCTKNPLPDIELNTTPILETFKPAIPNKGFISKEKEIK